MAAGLGFKDFVTGEVLTAADVDGYLMQNIWVFANATARDAAVTSPQEGNACYLKDTDAVMTYSGSAWVAVGGSVPTSYGYSAGKNKVINGDFGVWQRGTSFTTPGYAYTSDRWTMDADGAFATSITVSQQTFTPGTAPVAGYEGTYFYRLVYTKAGSQTAQYVKQRIEDVRQFAGQTATVSFWAKCDAARSVGVSFAQNFGSGGSGTVTTSGGTASATTAWQRFSYTVSIPSISGKTIGTSSFLELVFTLPNASSTTDIWGVQLEAGSTATAFQTATGTLQGELAACQRYYFKLPGSNNIFYAGFNNSTTEAYSAIPLPVTMRVRPTTTVTSAASNLAVRISGGSNVSCNGTTSVIGNTLQNLWFSTTVASGLTAGQGSALINIGGAEALEMSAEL